MVRLKDNALGLIHRSRLPERLKDDFCVGDEIYVRILNIEVNTQRVNLEIDLERYFDNKTSNNIRSPSKNHIAILKYKEGTKREVKINHYERSPEARRTCIAYHGITCCVCGFSFVESYGVIGEGYIHVHHLNPISEQAGEYLLDPVSDMRPVCANCHVMIHKRRPPYSIEEMRQLIQNPLSTNKTVDSTRYRA